MTGTRFVSKVLSRKKHVLPKVMNIGGKLIHPVRYEFHLECGHKVYRNGTDQGKYAMGNKQRFCCEFCEEDNYNSLIK